MASNQTCPECGSHGRRKEAGEYAMLKLTSGGTLELHTDRPGTMAFVVQAEVCSGCGRVTLYEAS